MNRPKILVFESGTSHSGGSGLKSLVEAFRKGVLDADIVGVVSNYENGGVRIQAEKLNIPFIYFPKPRTAEDYQRIAAKSGANFFILSGWFDRVVGLDPDTSFNSKTVINIHPGPLPKFGGVGMYGDHVHEAVMESYKKGEVQESGFCIHFVTEEYDEGPVFFRGIVPIQKDDTPETLEARVDESIYAVQGRIINLVVRSQIRWDGVKADSLRVDVDPGSLSGVAV